MDNDSWNIIKSDFDSIAVFDEPVWDHNKHYFKKLLSYIPEQSDIALDIGCGKGELSAMLSQKCRNVIAVDISPNMIKSAERLHPAANINYICSSITELSFENNSLDAIITTATLHHLPYKWFFSFAADKLKPGGKLIVLDIAAPESIADQLFWVLAILPNLFIGLIKNGRIRMTASAQAAWNSHTEHDEYTTINSVRKIASKYCPGVSVKRKLFWRYLLLWQK